MFSRAGRAEFQFLDGYSKATLEPSNENRSEANYKRLELIDEL